MKPAALIPLAALVLMAATPAKADWYKSYVFDWIEPAMYYGADDGVANPGTDCPLGTMPEPDWKKMLLTSWRTEADVAKIMNPEGPTRQRDGGFRGPAPDISVYAQPWTIPDPGVFEVIGDKAYGFNLDGDEKTGFLSADGKTRGVDNAYYKAIGCFGTWRGPARKGHHQSYVMEGMHNGSFAIVMIVSGTGSDPNNDPNASVGFYTSLDKLVKDANGGIAHDYSFRINPAALQHVAPARTVGGAIELKAPTTINVRGVDGPMKIEEARMRFEEQPDGSLVGFIGGYRSVNDLYAELAGGAATYELTMRMNTPAVWYSLQRNADHRPNENGVNTMMSTAYRFFGKPAHAVSPDARQVIVKAEPVTAPPGFSVASASGRMTPAAATSE